MFIRKDSKIQKSRKEEKTVGFSSASIFLTKKWEAATQGRNIGIDHLMWRTQGAIIVRSWEDKRDCGHISDTFT